MPSHPHITRLQALLLDHLLSTADECRRLHAAQALRAAAYGIGDSLEEEDDSALAGWLAGMLRRLEG